MLRGGCGRVSRHASARRSTRVSDRRGWLASVTSTTVGPFFPPLLSRRPTSDRRRSVTDSQSAARANAEVLQWQGRLRIIVALAAGGVAFLLVETGLLEGHAGWVL